MAPNEKAKEYVYLLPEECNNKKEIEDAYLAGYYQAEKDFIEKYKYLI